MTELKKRLPPIHALRVFETTARYQSISRAAEELLVTKPAVSYQIRQLEEWVGAQLFEKVGRNIQLTDAGRELSGTVCEAFVRISEVAGRLKRTTGNIVNVSVSPSVGMFWLMPRLSAFHERYPDITLRVGYFMGNDTVGTGQSDVVIRYCREPYQGMGNSKKLISARLIPVATPEYRAAHAEDLSDPLGLQDAMLLHDNEHDRWLEWFTRYTGVAPDTIGGHIYGDFTLLRQAVLAGNGVALCPEELIRPELESGLLVPVLDMGLDEDAGYYAISPNRERDCVACFLDWLEDEKKDAGRELAEAG